MSNVSSFKDRRRKTKDRRRKAKDRQRAIRCFGEWRLAVFHGNSSLADDLERRVLLRANLAGMTMDELSSHQDWVNALDVAHFRRFRP